MIFEIILIVILLFGLCVLGYRGAIHEFQILQREYEPDVNWSEPLSEHLPLVIRNLPRAQAGNWTLERTQTRTWPVRVKNEQKILRTSWDKWIKHPEHTLQNGKELGVYAKLDKTVGNWMDIRRWFWLPPSFTSPQACILPDSQYVGITKTSAEATVLVATDGNPLEIWISHEGGIPAAFVEDLVGKNPWIQTTNEIPDIHEVKYIEILLRPNNALVIPSHWWYAIRSSETGTSWYWTAEFHSPVSFVATKLKGQKS